MTQPNHTRKLSLQVQNIIQSQVAEDIPLSPVSLAPSRTERTSRATFHESNAKHWITVKSRRNYRTFKKLSRRSTLKLKNTLKTVSGWIRDTVDWDWPRYFRILVVLGILYNFILQVLGLGFCMVAIHYSYTLGNNTATATIQTAIIAILIQLWEAYFMRNKKSAARIELTLEITIYSWICVFYMIFEQQFLQELTDCAHKTHVMLTSVQYNSSQIQSKAIYEFYQDSACFVNHRLQYEPETFLLNGTLYHYISGFNDTLSNLEIGLQYLDNSALYSLPLISVLVNLVLSILLTLIFRQCVHILEKEIYYKYGASITKRRLKLVQLSHKAMYVVGVLMAIAINLDSWLNVFGYGIPTGKTVPEPGAVPFSPQWIPFMGIFGVFFFTIMGYINVTKPRLWTLVFAFVIGNLFTFIRSSYVYYSYQIEHMTMHAYYFRYLAYVSLIIGLVVSFSMGTILYNHKALRKLVPRTGDLDNRFVLE